MARSSVGIITAAAVLVGLLLGLAFWRSPAVGFVPQAGEAARALQMQGIGGESSLGRTISVSGSGEVRAKPDLAFVTVGVETQAAEAGQAQQENATRSAAVVEAVKKLQIPASDIQTSALSLQPVYDSQRRPNGEPAQIVGYRATNRITVRVADINKTGPVLDEAVKAGANVAGSIRFGFANDAELRQQALKEAGQDARGKAEAIAGGLGVTISGVYSAGESSVSVPYMAQDALRGAQAAPQAPTPVEPGEMTISAQLRVVYSY